MATPTIRSNGKKLLERILIEQRKVLDLKSKSSELLRKTEDQEKLVKKLLKKLSDNDLFIYWDKLNRVGITHKTLNQ